MRDIKTFFKIFKDKKKNFIAYSFLSLFVGILELFGVALTYPFILKLLNNEQNISEHTLINSPIFIGLAIILLFLLKNIFMILYTQLQIKFLNNMEISINLSFMNYFLSSNYQDTSKISIAEKNKILNFIIPNIISNYLQRLLNLNVNIFIFSLISLFLIIKFPLATIITICFASIIIVIQNKLFQPKLENLAKNLSCAATKYNQKTNDAIINIKSVKISNNEFFFFENYKKAITEFFSINRKSLFYKTIPPYITEPFTIILLFILLAIISIENFAEPEKLVASYAVIVSAIFRLTPTIARIQTNLNGINTTKPIIKEFLNLCEKYKIVNLKEIKKQDFQEFKNSIELKNVSFKYNQNNDTLQNINLRIQKGEFIGIAGLSGAGKTTLIDIISGILKNNTGEILVDGIKPEKKLKIGYIPQEINIINDTIKNNITYGHNENGSDEKVIQILRDVQLYDFITNTFKKGIYANPFIDSTGFSQGQKQRLGIARALYTNPDVLILDEATSSLDLKTEDEICNVLKELKNEKTIIAVAHRLSTIKTADRIIFMQDGRIVNIAPFQELIECNKDFKDLVNLANLEN